jgi:hypothetical protein
MPTMNPISSAEMALMRADVAALLDLDCTIKRPTKTKDAWGTDTEVLNTISPNGLKAGMRSPKATTLEIHAFRIGSKLAWEVDLPYATDVAELDHIIIGSDEMVVQALLSVQSYNTLTTVLATETV